MYRNSDAVIRPELSTVVEEAAFCDSYFIGLKVFPIYNSTKRTGQFMKITAAASEVQKKNITERAQKTGYGKVDRSYEKDEFSATDRGLEEQLDDSVTAELADFFSTETTTSKLLLRSIMLDHELRVATKVQDTNNFDAVASTVAYTAVNIATIDFATDLQNAIKRVKKRGELVNTLIMNRDLFDRIRQSTKLAAFLFGPLGGGQQITAEMIGKSFGIETVLIADATYDSSPKGKTGVADYIWSPASFWVGNVAGGDFAAGGAGRTIVWTGDAESIFVTETYRDESTRSDIIRVRCNTDEKVISKPAGTLVTTSFA